MNKKYSIEVPIYASPLKHLIELNRAEDISIVVYGGVPDSPLNGGRFNYSLDGLFLWNRPFFSLTKSQLSRALAKFYKTLEEANKNGIAFRIAYTNMFVSPDELNEGNLYPVERLVESSKKYGVKNGLMLNNKLLEDRIRQKYGDKLVYVSSCTKYVSPHKILTPHETLNMYLEDSKKYDFVCMTPQDSAREHLIKDVLLGGDKNKIIAICNSVCTNRCNSYYHYEYISKENKRSLITVANMSILSGIFSYVARRPPRCSAFRQVFGRVGLENMAKMQLRAGIVNFKIGRGFGAKLIDPLVSLIRTKA